MPFEAVFTILVLLLLMTALYREVASTDALFFAALGVLMLAGIISPQEALSGFSNPSVVTVGVLFIVSAAIQNTGALNDLMYVFLKGDSRSRMPALMARLMVPVSFLSAFINNTPLVMIFVPLVRKWSEKINIPGSKFFIPLSYAAILGGMCTLIGTSTNLVVHGLMQQSGLSGFSMFELAGVGIPCALAGMLYMAFAGVKLLPNRKGLSTQLEESKKEYVVEMKVMSGCELDGKTVSQAGLRNLRGLFLIDIEREGKSMGPISSEEVIQAEDHLMFAGVTSAVVDLQEIPGLVPAADGAFEKDFATMRTHLVEAVVSAASPILGKTVKDANFRAKYRASVVAVHRNGERIHSKIGSIQLRAGDTLLLFASPEFLDDWKDSQEFYLVSSIKTKPPEARHKNYLALGITAAMVLAAAIGPRFIRLGGQPLTVAHCVFAAALLLVLTRCVRVYEARQSVRWDILLTIGCAFGISKALQNSGAASWIAGLITSHAAALGPLGVLMAIYLLTAFFTEMITNNAAAAFAFPVALAASSQLEASPVPFCIAVAIAASASFTTPIGYQTNLLVQGAGGYRFGDYTRVGLPLSLICFALASLLIPVFWPF